MAAPAAFAQNAPKPDESNAKKAEAEYNTAKRAEDLGNLRLAAVHYKRAYDLYPTPLLLYTLAHVHRMLGDKKVALDYYKRYAEADPNGPRITPAKKYIKILSDALANPIPIPPDEDDDDDGGGGKVDGGGTGGTAGGGAGGGGDDSTLPPVGGPTNPGAGDDTGGGSSALRWVGIAMGAVGAAGLITGTLYGLKAQGLSDDINNPGPSWEQDELDKFQEGEDAERNQVIFSVAGGALLLGGITIVIIDAMGGDSDSGAKTVASPVVGPDGLGFAVSGRF